MAGISHVSDKVLFGQETSGYGTVSGTFTVDFGHLQSVSATENETLTKIGGIGSGHTGELFEDGIYYVSGTMETIVTKDAIPNLLKAFYGSRSDGTDYTVTSSLSGNSYSYRMEYDSTQYLQVTGVVFTTLNIDIARDGNYVVNMDYVGKKMDKVSGTLTTTQNTDKILTGLDCSLTYGGTSYIANNFTLSSTWNIDPTEGRGIESVPTGQRRLIQKVVRHTLDNTGSMEVEVKSDFPIGYFDERNNKSLVVTASRGSDNAHVLTLSSSRTDTKDITANTDNSKRTVSMNYQALDVVGTGDL